MAFHNSIFGQPKYNVTVPEDYQESTIEKYPLFIVLHGGNSNKESIHEWWHSDELEQNFIVAYMDANTLDRKPNRWGWRKIDEERENISQYVSEIASNYRIDYNQIFVGGFSLGGRTSLDLLATQPFKVQGIISVNHGGGISPSFTAANIDALKTLNKKIILVSGEKDYHYKHETLEISRLLTLHNIEHHYIVIPNLGHSAPNNFSVLLKQYLTWLKP